MNFIERFAGKMSSGTRVLSQKTDEIIEITQLKMDLKNIESEIEEAKLYIGEMMYKYFLNHQDTMPAYEIKSKCNEIGKLEQQKNKMKVRLNRIRGMGYCNFCGETLEEGENFCPKCGKRINRYL